MLTLIAKAKIYTNGFFVIFLASILALSLFMFSTPTSYSDKDDDDESEDKKESGINFFTLQQKLNAGIQCNQVEVKDKNIALCKDSGTTKPFMIAKNGMNGANGMNNVNAMNGANCPTQSEIIPLTGALEPQGIRLLADLDPCMINDGSITLTIPYTQDIKVAVMYLDKAGTNHQSALVDLAQVQMLSNGQGLFKLDLNQVMMGKNTNTGQMTTLGKINGLALYNSGAHPIPFGPSNSAALTAILAPGQTPGGSGLPQGNIMGQPPGPNMLQGNVPGNLQGNIPGNQLIKLGSNFPNPSSPMGQNQLIQSGSNFPNQFSSPMGQNQLIQSGSNFPNQFSSPSPSSSTPFPNPYSPPPPPPYTPPANTVANQFSSTQPPPYTPPANTVANQFSSTQPPAYTPPANTLDSLLQNQFSASTPASTPAPTPTPYSPPAKTTTSPKELSSKPSFSLANVNKLDQKQIIDGISSKISKLKNVEKNKISQALFEQSKLTAENGGDVMKNLRQIGTTILQNPADPMIDKITEMAQTR